MTSLPWRSYRRNSPAAEPTSSSTTAAGRILCCDGRALGGVIERKADAEPQNIPNLVVIFGAAFRKRYNVISFHAPGGAFLGSLPKGIYNSASSAFSASTSC